MYTFFGNPPPQKKVQKRGSFQKKQNQTNNHPCEATLMKSSSEISLKAQGFALFKEKIYIFE